MLLFTRTFAQVEINNSILFTNESDSLSQIYNLGTVTDSCDLTKINNATNEKLITVALSGQGNYSFSSPFNGFKLEKGVQLHAVIDSTNLISPKIIFSNDTFPVLNQNGDAIPILNLNSNSIIRMIFTGNDFRILQFFRIGCPDGFISVNDNYCIEINERATAIYTDAIATCNSIGASLCTWGEWYHACVNLNGSSVFNMTNNWEFINDCSDHTTTYAIVGAPGFGGCLGFTSENVNNFNRNFRCCYKK